MLPLPPPPLVDRREVTVSNIITTQQIDTYEERSGIVRQAIGGTNHHETCSGIRNGRQQLHLIATSCLIRGGTQEKLYESLWITITCRSKEKSPAENKEEEKKKKMEASQS